MRIMIDSSNRRQLINHLASDSAHQKILDAIKIESERKRIKALVEDYYIGFMSGLLDVQKLAENRVVDLTDLSDGDIPKKEDGR